VDGDAVFVFLPFYLEHIPEVMEEHPDGMYHEGAGDALFCGDTLFGGYLIRSDAQAMQWVAGRIGCRAIPLELVDPYYYHLDTCFCPLSSTEAIYYPGAFDEYGRHALTVHVPELVPVHPDEAARFACNAVVIGRHVVLNTGCPRLEADLTFYRTDVRDRITGDFRPGGPARAGQRGVAANRSVVGRANARAGRHCHRARMAAHSRFRRDDTTAQHSGTVSSRTA
jgi:hypothetical protein